MAAPLWVVKQVVSHPMASVVGYAGLTGLLIGYPPTRRLGLKLGSFGLRAGAAGTWGAMRGIATTTLVRGGSVTLAGGVVRASGAIGSGYVLGATVGTAIAYAGWGEEGADDAFALYTGQVSSDEYLSVVGGALKHYF